MQSPTVRTCLADAASCWQLTTADANRMGDGKEITFYKFQIWWYNEKERKPPKFWAVRSFTYREGTDGEPVADKCISEIQELIADGTITEKTFIWTDEFDEFRPLSTCRKIKELQNALAAKYCSSMIYRDEDAQASGETPPTEVRELIRTGVISEDSKVKSGADAAGEEGEHGLGGQLADWTPLADVKHVFGLAEYMPLADDGGGIVADDGPDLALLSKSLEKEFNLTAWSNHEGLREG